MFGFSWLVSGFVFRFCLATGRVVATGMAENVHNTSDPDVEAVGALGDHYAKISLEEVEEVGLEILDSTSDSNPGAGVDLRWAAVGRFLTDKNIRVEAIQQVLASVWRPVRGVRVKDIAGNRFVFQFFHEKDIQRILSDGPWAFENATLVLKRLKEGDQPANVVLDSADYWIQVHEVPCGFMTERIAEQIGRSLGSFVQSDPNNFGGNWKSYMRIRVSIDVNHPLRRILKLRKNGGAWAWVSFKYEQLFTFCYFCGCVGHSVKFYAKAIDVDKDPSEYEFGPWLRAPLRRLSTSVGERWLVKDEQLNDTYVEPGYYRGSSSGAVSLKVDSKMGTSNVVID